MGEKESSDFFVSTPEVWPTDSYVCSTHWNPTYPMLPPSWDDCSTHWNPSWDDAFRFTTRPFYYRFTMGTAIPSVLLPVRSARFASRRRPNSTTRFPLSYLGEKNCFPSPFPFAKMRHIFHFFTWLASLSSVPKFDIDRISSPPHQKMQNVVFFPL